MATDIQERRTNILTPCGSLGERHASTTAHEPCNLEAPCYLHLHAEAWYNTKAINLGETHETPCHAQVVPHHTGTYPTCAWFAQAIKDNRHIALAAVHIDANALPHTGRLGDKEVGSTISEAHAFPQGQVFNRSHLVSGGTGGIAAAWPDVGADDGGSTGHVTM